MASRRNEEEWSLIQKCLAGDKAALNTFRTRYLKPLRRLLVARGAGESEADDIVATLWTDCATGDMDRPPLFERYTGRASLKNWLFRVGVNLFVDSRRKANRHVELVMVPRMDCDDCLHDAPFVPAGRSEGALLELLRDSLQTAFDRCPPEDLLRLRLVYQHGLTMREVARMWRCHQGTLSRDLARSLQTIAHQTLHEVQRLDPQLKLTWEDFLLLCDTEPLEFL